MTNITSVDDGAIADFDMTAEPSITTVDDFVRFYTLPINQKKYRMLSNIEKELLFYFDKISYDDKLEIIEILKIKAKKSFR